MGAENHWGPEKSWGNLKRLYEAIDHPGFGISLHLGSWTGTDDERHAADAAVAPWVCHTHFDQKTCEGRWPRKWRCYVHLATKALGVSSITAVKKSTPALPIS